MQISATRMSIGSAPATAATRAVEAQPDLGPPPALVVPDNYQAGLTAALALGAADGASYLSSHAAGDLHDLSSWATKQIGPPPGADVQKTELAELHRIADARTPDEAAAFKWYALHGHRDMWSTYLDEYAQRVGKDQARVGAALLQRTSDLTEQMTNDAKDHYGRVRPYNADPSLHGPIDRPANDSYPSGHTSLAYAAALTLATLMPDRRDELLAQAAKVGYSRLVGSMHFPSDVLAGARMAALAVTVALAQK